MLETGGITVDYVLKTQETRTYSEIEMENN